MQHTRNAKEKLYIHVAEIINRITWPQSVIYKRNRWPYQSKALVNTSEVLQFVKNMWKADYENEVGTCTQVAAKLRKDLTDICSIAKFKKTIHPQTSQFSPIELFMDIVSANPPKYKDADRKSVV